jgi:predicted permease
MGIWQDIRFALRVSRKNLGFTAIVVFLLTLGIGANTTVFTLVNAVLFRPLPFVHGERIVVLFSSNPSKGAYRMGASYPDYIDWQKQAKSFEALAAWSAAPVNLSDATNPPDRYSATRMTANSFELIGQKPILGRDFSPQDAQIGVSPVAILGYGIWKNRYGGDRNIVGRTIRLNEIPTTVIGIMPEGLRFPLSSDLWLPLIRSGDLQKRDDREIVVFGRMAQGVTLPAARAEMAVVARRLQSAYPKSNEGVIIEVDTFNDTFSGAVRPLFLALLGAVGFVLLIACANVANLMLARAMSRAREVSIRSALGASRWRIVQQLLVESILLSMIGALLGFGLSLSGVHAFDLAVSAVDKPYWIKFTTDWTVFGFIAGITMATGILFGIVPAVYVSRTNVNQRLKEGTRGAGSSLRARFFSAGLVVVEMALAMILLAGAGVLIRSFLNLQEMQGGVNTDRLLSMQIDLPEAKYPTPEARRQMRDRLVAGVRSAPVVESVALASHAPIQGSYTWRFQLEARPAAVQNAPTVSGLYITPDYFRTLGAPLLRGRAFEESDGGGGRQAVIVNERFARKYWPGEDPIGKRLRLQRDPGDGWYTVSGISRDLRQNDPNQRPELDPLVYLPYREDPDGSAIILARTRTVPASVVSELRKRVQAIDENLPVYRVMTMEQVFSLQRWPYHVFGSMFVIFAGVALILSAVGIYGVMAYTVAQRSREIGVRIALGANSANILSTVMSHGVIQMIVGLVLGLGGAFALTGVLKSMLVRIRPTDPVTFSAVALVLIGAAVLACWVPARRALKLDPAIALRYE